MKMACCALPDADDDPETARASFAVVPTRVVVDEPEHFAPLKWPRPSTMAQLQDELMFLRYAARALPTGDPRIDTLTFAQRRVLAVVTDHGQIEVGDMWAAVRGVQVSDLLAHQRYAIVQALEDRELIRRYVSRDHKVMYKYVTPKERGRWSEASA